MFSVACQRTVEKKTEIAESIIDAAERLLNSYGYQKMTMTDLAAEAGIGVGTTYLHFASKADVAVAVVARVHDRLLDQMKVIACSDLPADRRLAEALVYRVSTPYNYVRNKLCTISWQQFLRHGREFFDDIRIAYPMRFADWKVSEAAVLADIIREGYRTGVFIEVDADRTAEALLDATCGFFPKNLEQHDFNEPDHFEARVRNVIHLLVNGLVRERYV